MANVPIINEGLFNYAARILGGEYARYAWEEKKGGLTGKLEEGELFKDGKVVSVAINSNIIDTIRSKARELAATTLVFSPSVAIPTKRIYGLRTKTPLKKIDLKTIPGTDDLYAKLMTYLGVSAQSCDEGEVIKLFTADLKSLGFEVRQRPTGKFECWLDNKKISARAGNLVAVLRGDPSLPSFQLSVHMDRETPQKVPPPIVREGDIIKTDGTSVLGGDDAAGVVLILEFVRYLNDNHIPHGDIYITGLVAEEAGVLGAEDIVKTNDYEALQGDIGLTLDGFNSNTVIYGGSHFYVWDLKVYGKGLHPAFSAEAINATNIAAKILASGWRLGAGSAYHGNPGTVVVTQHIEGGTADPGKTTVDYRNSVPNLAVLNGQMRTSEPDGSIVTAQMKQDVERICAETGARCEFSAKLVLPGFQDPGTPILGLVANGYRLGQLPDPSFGITHGGSNLNLLFPLRGDILLMPTGGKGSSFHTVGEILDLKDMQKALIGLIGTAVHASQYQRIKR